MQFQLPSNLQTELLAYDPKLKALVREQSPKKQTKKSRYPLGNVPHLIPYDVVRQADQQGAIDIVNAAPAPQRIYSFTKPVDVATPQARVIVHALIFHYEQCWYACWLPPKGQENDYVYGHAYGFKDTAAAARTVPKSIWNARAICTQTEVGRSIFYTFSKCVTKDDIANGYSESRWRPDYFNYYADKSRQYIAPCIKNFEESLKASIPYWVDERNMFGKLACKNIADAIDINHYLLSKTDNLDVRQQWLPSFDAIYAFVHTNSLCSEDLYRFPEFSAASKIRHILDTPFFRKWINAKCQECIDTFNDPANEYRRHISAPWKQILKLIRSIESVNNIWPDCPLDYYQTHVNQLLGVDLSYYSHQDIVARWLRQHMPVASFFSILAKFYEDEETSYRTNGRNVVLNEELRINTYRFYSWMDTYSMIGRVLNAGKELAPPKRWRLTEFHDYVQAENWKVQNPNEALHQDLFPEPIRVSLDFAGRQANWTFLQPQNTHQLAMWGQAVRNCVGSASHYAADIKKRKHFIVLAMIDGKPTFTIQLKVDMGVMSVAQIAGIANQRLDDTDRELYTEAFQLALQERESQLKS